MLQISINSIKYLLIPIEILPINIYEQYLLVIIKIYRTFYCKFPINTNRYMFLLILIEKKHSFRNSYLILIETRFHQNLKKLLEQLIGNFLQDSLEWFPLKHSRIYRSDYCKLPVYPTRDLLLLIEILPINISISCIF